MLQLWKDRTCDESGKELPTHWCYAMVSHDSRIHLETAWVLDVRDFSKSNGACFSTLTLLKFQIRSQ